MADIEIERRHHLGVDEARHVVEHLAADLSGRYGGQYGWDGDTMLFARTGARGAIRVAPDFVLIMINLGPLGRPFKSRIEVAINTFIDEYLTGA